MNENSTKNILFRVQRYNPESGKEPWFEEFTIPAKRGMTILDGLLYIKENLDSTLSFRTSCRMGICGSCGMIVNNEPHLACHTQIEEFDADTITVKSLPNQPVIKDLVPDLQPFFSNHKSIKPFIIRKDEAELENPTAEYEQSPEELDLYEQFAYCIKCGLCAAACPTSATDILFLGPQALAQCYRYSADGRDSGVENRIEAVDTDHGVWRCHLAGACSQACPKGVDPALAVQLLKRMLAGKALGMGKKREVAAVAPAPSEFKEKVEYPAFTVEQS